MKKTYITPQASKRYSLADGVADFGCKWFAQ